MVATVCFAHGMESGPCGRKITALASVARDRGWAVESPDYRFTREPQARLAHLLQLGLPAGRELVLVGSSMGGYVSAMACERLQPAGLLLMAPAVYLPGYPGEPRLTAPHCAIVHGWRDELIPPANAWRLAEGHRAELHLLDDDHGLAASLPVIEQILARLLDACAAEPAG